MVDLSTAESPMQAVEMAFGEGIEGEANIPAPAPEPPTGETAAVSKVAEAPEQKQADGQETDVTTESSTEERPSGHVPLKRLNDVIAQRNEVRVTATKLQTENERLQQQIQELTGRVQQNDPNDYQQETQDYDDDDPVQKQLKELSSTVQTHAQTLQQQRDEEDYNQVMGTLNGLKETEFKFMNIDHVLRDLEELERTGVEVGPDDFREAAERNHLQQEAFLSENHNQFIEAKKAQGAKAVGPGISQTPASAPPKITFDNVSQYVTEAL